MAEVQAAPSDSPSLERTLWIAGAIWALFVFAHVVVNVESLLTEAARRGSSLAAWEPWTWELSSAASLFALTPAVVWLCRVVPILPPRRVRNGCIHVICSVLFSLLHVFAMVGIREAVYSFVNEQYRFGSWPAGLLYEYRKDLLTYALMIAAIHVLIYVIKPHVARGARAQAAPPEPAAQSAPPPPEPYLSRLLVQHNHREQVVTMDKVQWIEADGNYLKLHTAQGTFRPRMSLTSLEGRLDPSLFVRIHRSHLVSIGAVKEVQPWFHGDFRVVLESGETLPLSRRFRERLKFG